MKLTDLSSLTDLAPTGTHTATRPTSDAADTAAEVFARMLVGEIRKTLPEGGLLGDGHFSVLESVLDEALAAQLADADGLGLQRLFGGSTVPTSPAPPGSTPPPDHTRPTTIDAPRLVEGGLVTSRFGPRNHPILGTEHHHGGIDIAAPQGSPIHAAAAGIVRHAAEQGGYGNVVILDHGGGVETRYAHCESISVEPGQRVEAGAQLGTVGSTGRSTGPHLHFELRHDGIPVDPEAAPWPSLIP